MAKQRHLKNAPITEAIIDFRTKLPPTFDIKKLLLLKEDLSDKFPKFEEYRFIKSGFEIKEGKPVSALPEDHGIHGCFLRPEDEKKVVQFRIDGFTYSQLKPYTHWKEFVSEAKELWKLYADKAQPEFVTRIAVRYINHMDLPLPITDFSKYLTAPPNVPKELPGSLGRFLSKVVIYNSETDISANITQALEKSVTPNYVTIILDVDAYKFGEFDSNNDDIWPIFEELHDIKNQIFFNSITEETARLFE